MSSFDVPFLKSSILECEDPLASFSLVCTSILTCFLFSIDFPRTDLTGELISLFEDLICIFYEAIPFCIESCLASYQLD